MTNKAKARLAAAAFCVLSALMYADVLLTAQELPDRTTLIIATAVQAVVTVTFAWLVYLLAMIYCTEELR